MEKVIVFCKLYLSEILFAFVSLLCIAVAIYGVSNFEGLRAVSIVVGAVLGQAILGYVIQRFNEKLSNTFVATWLSGFTVFAIAVCVALILIKKPIVLIFLLGSFTAFVALFVLLLIYANRPYGEEKLDEQKRQAACKLFKLRWGKTPQEAGYKAIGIYKKQSAFLYAVSEEVIQAYKTQQNILRWLLAWFMFPLAIGMIIFFIGIFKYQDPLHPLCIAFYVFYTAWVGLFIVLFVKARQANKLVKMDKTVTYLTY